VGVDGCAADEAMGQIELEGELAADGREDAEGLGHDLWTDAIAGEDGNFKRRHAMENERAGFGWKAEFWERKTRHADFGNRRGA
jgi:hypothetical protein